MATEHLVGFRDVGKNVENETEEIHLGVGGAEVEGLGKVGGEATRQANGGVPKREDVVQ